MSENVYTFKTNIGDTLLGILHSINEKLQLYNIILPIKINLIPTQTKTGLFTQYIPQLYQPFGTTNVIPIKMSFINSILPCTDFDSRYYFKLVTKLAYIETKRLLYTEKLFDAEDYPDLYIMPPHSTIQ